MVLSSGLAICIIKSWNVRLCLRCDAMRRDQLADAKIGIIKTWADYLLESTRTKTRSELRGDLLRVPDYIQHAMSAARGIFQAFPRATPRHKREASALRPD